MNVNPFRRHRATDDNPVERALRRSLARHAFEAPDADELTRRILAAAENEPEPWSVGDRPRRAAVDDHPSRGPWKTWGLPLVAAASVAAVVGIGAAVASIHPGHDDTHQQAATQAPSTARTTVTRTVTPLPAVSTSTGTSGLVNVKIVDLTFVGPNDGIALASSQCLAEPAKRCTALLQTSDGHTWTQKGGGIDFDVPGVKGCPASDCVDHIRFARSDVGYAYGPQAFFMTTDGGAKWVRQPGGAAALETLDNNVVRVSSTDPGGCPPGCSYVVQTAAIGSPTWSDATLPGSATGDAVQLARGGSYAYLLITGNPAGGASSAMSTLYRSSDDGTDWTDAGEPCRQSGGEVDSYQVAAGIGGDVTVLCRARDSGPFHVAVSSDGGASFSPRAGTIAASDVAAQGFDLGSLPTVLAGDPTTVLAVAGRGVSVSRDGGVSWAQSNDLVGTFASVGFENKRVGRAVSADGTQIWTTRDAGRTWHSATP